MAKQPEEHPAEIHLEDLLRLKRSERPSEQFWQGFDRELHQRMLQTLVKKDPWYLQLLRGLSSRIVRRIAVSAAAAVIAMMVVRPTLQPVGGPEQVAQVAQVAQLAAAVQADAGSVQADAGSVRVVESVGEAVDAVSMASSFAEMAEFSSAADYHADAFSVAEVDEGVNFVREFGMESMQVASYEASAYSVDTADAHVAFAATGVARFVY
jgi:hypothetical protein